VNLPHDPYVYRYILYSADLTFLQIVDQMTLEMIARHVLELDCFDDFSNYESVEFLMEIFQRVFLYESERGRVLDGQAMIPKLKDIYVDLVLDGKARVGTDPTKWTDQSVSVGSVTSPTRPDFSSEDPSVGGRSVVGFLVGQWPVLPTHSMKSSFL